MDTVELIPNSTPIPCFTDKDAIEQVVKDIVHILNNPSKNNIPKFLHGNKIQNAFQQVASILQQDESTPTPLPNLKNPRHHPKNRCQS